MGDTSRVRVAGTSLVHAVAGISRAADAAATASPGEPLAEQAPEPHFRGRRAAAASATVTPRLATMLPAV
ncbi:MAG: hypothetical protein KGI34_23010 [Bradyrhizobium sp.]|nr:hypothetical protein [Bradyrhizobium sp.]